MSKDMLGDLIRILVTAPTGVLAVIFDLMQKLTGADGASWLAALKRFLRKENPWPMWPVWRTIQIGRHKTLDAWTKALEAAGCRVSDWGRQILSKVTFAQEVQDLELVVVTGRELCGDRDATVSEIFAAGLARGLRKCPAEVGPALREQYKDQPKGEWLLVAMEPIKDSDGDLSVFRVGRDDDGPWLCALDGRPDGAYRPVDRWVFLAPRKQ